MDLILGYWQVDLPQADQEKCAIISSQGLFQPLRMPQGLCNAPATFQRAMDAILGDLKMSCVLVYLDDINVFSRTFGQHLEHLEEVFRQLMSSNLKIKPRKCQFFKEQLEYLGFVIDAEGLRPQPQKLKAISKMASPANMRDVQVFLGMVGYYRRFIKGFADLAQPLFHLLKKDTSFNWSSDCKMAFDELRQRLMEAPVLRYPDFDKEFIVQTDASLVAAGAVLSQIGDDGEEHPVAYCSQSLDKHKQNYTVTERECLAVIYACKQFRVYIHGTKFKVVTDHASLTWLRNLKEPEGRLARWALKLQAHDYEIIHRPGSCHQNADCLSRLPTVAALLPFADGLYDKMVAGTYQDEPPEIVRTVGKLLENTAIVDGQLYKVVDNQRLVYPRPSLCTNLIIQAHRAVGHGGLRKTLEQLRNSYHWESMPFDVQDTLERCHECQMARGFKPRTVYQTVKPGWAWHTVSIDVVGPLPASSNRLKYIIVAIEHLTKWVEVRAIADVGAVTTARFIIEQIIYRHGCPQAILTNNGTNFTSHVIPRLNEHLGVRGILSTPYHPETNGVVERANGTLVGILRKLVADSPSRWPLNVGAAAFAYNLSYHSGTGHSPFRLLYGRQPALPPLLYSLVPPSGSIDPSSYVSRLAQTLIKIQAEAYEHSVMRRDRQKEKDNLSRAPLHTFLEGDEVAYCDSHGFGRHHKLAKLWLGPCTVLEKNSDFSYAIKKPDGQILNRVHSKFLRPYRR